MKITKTNETKYVIEFDETEIQNLEDIEDIFEVPPEDVIRNSVTESLRLGAQGVRNLINTVTDRRGNNGNSDTESD